ncbi:TPA: transcription termination/antitermination protein NusA [Patescibacteria group bacterium]|nr:MAG: NusA antitermination factor [Parcubacteria group bacterium GW2011_GWF2_40_10]KKR46861.1 MAG: NusA antitermination factor [Parcubacteria group bacterium GW2011_GWA2_40_143]KKR60304.1 MAG: NusA antitermination factor [Parcubacteria group bacterium GW2011_GWC2_40_31]KKR75343.1 MAG: NusA antitermination factor [Parcubacteria group bacterium GW2011_GWB2_40_8]KKR75740.1 MAG: NusA antitermination factor [Parcubacteria group bacterium GW2011_GWE2_40_8]KKR82409.1 MAG: NusA antitermination facto
MDIKALHSALEQLEAERNIPKDKIIKTIEDALAAAYKKDYGKRGQIVKAEFDLTSGITNFFQVKFVVDESMLKSEEEESEEEIPTEKEIKSLENETVSGERKVRFNPEHHIMIEEARKIKKDAEPGEEIVFPLESKDDYGRIAAQTAKQVIMQRIREAEKESIYGEYKDKQGEILSGLVQRIENNNVFVDLGRATAILPRDEQIRGERYRIGERTKALLFLVEETPRGISLILSRSHPKFIAKLFEMEIPEIAHGVVEIKNIAREAGSRSKIAVISTQDGVDPVGSCVGQKGTRIGTIISELGGEKIDIIEWSEDPSELISNSLSPAKILEVTANKEKREAKVLVDEDQLSLAIGKMGQNVRLAAKLTGWKIDIKSREGDTVAQATEEGEVIMDQSPSESEGESSE